MGFFSLFFYLQSFKHIYFIPSIKFLLPGVLRGLVPLFLKPFDSPSYRIIYFYNFE